MDQLNLGEYKTYGFGMKVMVMARLNVRIRFCCIVMDILIIQQERFEYYESWFVYFISEMNLIL